MRIQSITEVSTHQQSNPFVTHNAGSIMLGKSVSPMSFGECLRSQIQDVRVSATAQKAEGLAVGSVWGHYMPQWIPLKPELRQKSRA